VLRTGRPHTRPLAAVAAALLAILLVSACSELGDATSPTPTGPVNSTTSPSVPAAPSLVPDGDAADNLPVFADVIRAVWGGPDRDAGRAYVDALVAAGFAKADMELTRDRTTVGNPADSIQVAVLWQGACLVGQIGPSTPAPAALVLDQLPGGGCLVGETRPIDW